MTGRQFSLLAQHELRERRQLEYPGLGTAHEYLQQRREEREQRDLRGDPIERAFRDFDRVRNPYRRTRDLFEAARDDAFSLLDRSDNTLRAIEELRERILERVNDREGGGRPTPPPPQSSTLPLLPNRRVSYFLVIVRNFRQSVLGDRRHIPGTSPAQFYFVTGTRQFGQSYLRRVFLPRSPDRWLADWRVDTVAVPISRETNLYRSMPEQSINRVRVERSTLGGFSIHEDIYCRFGLEAYSLWSHMPVSRTAPRWTRQSEGSADQNSRPWTFDYVYQVFSTSSIWVIPRYEGIDPSGSSDPPRRERQRRRRMNQGCSCSNIAAMLAESIAPIAERIEAIEEALEELTEGEETDLSDLLEALEEIKEEVEKVGFTSTRSFNILGGDSWFAGDSTDARMTINPEQAIEDRRESIYPTPLADSRPVLMRSIVDVLESLIATTYHRAGYYRLPASLPESLSEPDRQGQQSLPDALSLVEWQITQWDALAGQYPIEIKYKNAQGEEATLNVQNQAETLAEILGLLLGISADVDISVELGMKGIVETIKAANAAILASDYGKANADFLSYKGKEFVREVPITITPGGRSMKDALTESKAKVAGWKFDDKEDFKDLVGRLLIGVEIIRAAFYRRYDNDTLFPGERIRNEREGDDAENQDWGEFLAEIRNPSARFRRDPIAPKPEIRDLSVDETPD